MAADTACKAIREYDADGSIVLVGAEPYPPYNRPPRSDLRQQRLQHARVDRLTRGDQVGGRLDLPEDTPEQEAARSRRDSGTATTKTRSGVAPSRRTSSSCSAGASSPSTPAAHTAVDDAGTTHEYERALLVTGGRPRRLPAGGGDVVYYRTLDDYRRVRELADRRGRFVVIGGGFIGSELAASLVSNGCTVSMVFPEAGIGARIFPEELSAFVTAYYRDRGVDVHAGRLVVGSEPGRVRLDDGTELIGDGVVAGLGIEPAAELAEAAAIEVADGIVVDELGRTSAPDVFAAGDVARFPAVALGKSIRVEHEDNAKSHGRAVGANMAGRSEEHTSELQSQFHLV